MRHAHLRVIGIARLQPTRDLLRRPAQLQLALDDLAQPRAPGQLGRLGAVRQAKGPPVSGTMPATRLPRNCQRLPLTCTLMPAHANSPARDPPAVTCPSLSPPGQPFTFSPSSAAAACEPGSRNPGIRYLITALQDSKQRPFNPTAATAESRSPCAFSQEISRLCETQIRTSPPPLPNPKRSTPPCCVDPLEIKAVRCGWRLLDGHQPRCTDQVTLCTEVDQ